MGLISLSPESPHYIPVGQGSTHISGTTVDIHEEELRTQVASGNVDAMVELGNVLLDQGLRADAESWFTRASQAGDRNAMYQLGWLYRDDENLDAAEYWFQQCSDCGDPECMHLLGTILKNKGDTAAGAAWFEKSANLGDPQGMAKLGFWFDQNGALDSAEAWYRKAAQQGSAISMHNLASLLGDSGRSEEAALWLQKAADTRSAEDQANGSGRYRWRTSFRRRLPSALLWLSPKGKGDCGNHAWYNYDGHVEHCYHCKVGVRAYSSDHFK
jgi:TPR repeat protein